MSQASVEVEEGSTLSEVKYNENILLFCPEI
jgi:hypothetical protein